MKLASVSRTLGILALTIIASPVVRAQDPGWYLGGNVGKTESKLEDDQLIKGLLSASATPGVNTTDNRNTGWKAFVGYRFNPYFSLEGGYFELGKFGFTSAASAPAGTLGGNVEVKGLNFDAVVNIPFTEKFSLFVRAGANYADTRDSLTGTGSFAVANANPKKRDLNYKYGAGLQYDFTNSFGMRGEYERYRINEPIAGRGDIDFASVGLLFRFGRHQHAPAANAPEPYVAPAPAPVVVETPAVVMVPVPAQTQQYCTLLDLTFDIDRDNIERDDKEKLKVVGTFLTKYPGTTAVIEGHTDNVGSPEHNMKLSLARAESVVTYLVNEVHIDRARLKAVGLGDTNPLADNATEEGKRQNRRIDAVIACVSDVEGLTVAPARITMALGIDFGPKQDEVLPEYKEELRKVANFMKANPSVTATVEGHAGQGQESAADAMAISKRRAENVVTYLVDNFGIDRSRLTAEGFGKTRRYSYSTTAEGRQENRRINILINYPKK